MEALNFFTGERITQIHGLLEKNHKLLRELELIPKLFSADILGSVINFLHEFPKLHPFEDGNKRTAFVCIDSFLRLNNFRLNVESKKGKTTEDEKFFWQNADSQKTKKQIRGFLQEHMVPRRKPNSVAQAISVSVSGNKQLLENLAAE